MSTFYSYTPSGSGPSSGVATPVVVLSLEELREALNQEFDRARFQAQRYFQIGSQYHKMPYYIRSGETFHPAENNTYCASNFLVVTGANEPLNLIQVFRQQEWAYKQCVRIFGKPEAEVTPGDLVEAEWKTWAMNVWNHEAELDNQRLGYFVGLYENTLENLKENVWKHRTLRVSEAQKIEWNAWKAELPTICGERQLLNIPFPFW